MSELSDDLDAVADSVISDARRLIDVEEEKRARPQRDARQPMLGREARALVESLSRKVTAEADLVERLADRRSQA